MLSIIIKTVIIFLLVVLVIHLIIKKTINERESSSIIHTNEVVCSTKETPIETFNEDEKEKEKIEDIVIHSSTNIVNISGGEDDLFNFVYKDKPVEKTKPMDVKIKPSNKNKDIVNDNSSSNTNIQGICSYDDEVSSYYQELK